jgi:hypothetical protein
MGNTYINRANLSGDNIRRRVLDGEVCISSFKLVMYNFSCSGDPCVIPVGVMKIL